MEQGNRLVGRGEQLDGSRMAAAMNDPMKGAPPLLANHQSNSTIDAVHLNSEQRLLSPSPPSFSPHMFPASVQ